MTVHRFTARALPVAALAFELLCAAPAGAKSAAGSSATSGIFASEKTPLHVGGSSTAKPASGGSIGSGLLRTVVALVVVVAVIYGITWILKRLRRSHDAKATGSGLASIATLPLGGNRSLHLVRAGADLILVGASDQGVSAIRSYSEADARASGLLGDGDEIDFDSLVPSGATEWRPAPEWNARPPRGAYAPGTIGHTIERLRRLTVRS